MGVDARRKFLDVVEEDDGAVGHADRHRHGTGPVEERRPKPCPVERPDRQEGAMARSSMCSTAPYAAIPGTPRRARRRPRVAGCKAGSAIGSMFRRDAAHGTERHAGGTGEEPAREYHPHWGWHL